MDSTRSGSSEDRKDRRSRSPEASPIRPSPEPAGVRLYFEGRESELKRQERLLAMRMQQLSLQELREQCTHRPMISPFARSLSRPRSLSPENRALGEVLNRKERLASRRREVAEEELRGCTFHPLTLRFCSVSGSPQRVRAHLHEKLHAHHAEQQRFKYETLPKVATEVEHAAHHLHEEPLKESDAMAIVERLLNTKAPSPPTAATNAEATHRPTISAVSAVLAQARRTRLQEATEVVERLLTRPPIKLVADVKEHHPPPTGDGRPDSRVPYLRKLFRLLSPSGAAMPVLDFATAATETLSAVSAADIISMLATTELPVVTEDAFVATALHDAVATGPKEYMYRPHNLQPPDEGYPFRPRLSSRSAELTKHRGPTAARRQSTETARQTARRKIAQQMAEQKQQDEARECTFAPQTTPYSGPIAAPPSWDPQAAMTRPRVATH